MPQNETSPSQKPLKAAFQWADPFHLHQQLQEEERIIRETARRYAQDKLLPARDFRVS